MIKLNKKIRIMCAAAALTLALLPVSCGTDDNNNNSSLNSNGTNSTSTYDGANDGNDHILDNAGDAVESGASRLESDVNGMTNNSAANNASSTATTKNNK